MVKLPDDIMLEWNGEQVVRRLIEEVFPRLKDNAFDKVYMSQRALISPKNDVVKKLNQKVIEIFPGAEVVYHSFDTVTDDPKNLWTQDFLNTIAPGGLPPHKLILKIGICSGMRVLIPRIPMEPPKESKFPYTKAVSSSCKGVSRITTKVLVKNGALPAVIGTFTRNVVFQEVLKLCDSVG
ncbi:uncharacterized protein LOC113312024 [Papaver somniferum]|uniref:uncharacterized protein LOC113312024 n=1 Tax=Papaver somniferum TaxID=3469 RepID=UPI000E6FC5F0|nr:uncharacterized protein LOC113312024 [Papaver somniferum]